MKISDKNISFITVPTKETLKNLQSLNIFNKSKIYYLPDPVYIKKQINNKTKIKNKLNFKFILFIGRLTNQKNQLLLIKSFFEISKKYKKLKLLILGEGEKYNEL